MNLQLEHPAGIEVASLAHQKQVTHRHQASTILDCNSLANFMGLAFKVEAFDFEALGIRAEHSSMVVAYLP